MKFKLATLLFVLGIFATVASYFYFENTGQAQTGHLTSEVAKVAGAQDKAVTDITREIPIISDAEIASVDTSNENTVITLESSKSQDEIESFYNDYFLVNGWADLGNGTYSKDEKVLNLHIQSQIIKISLID